jgi:hypothetical protein
MFNDGSVDSDLVTPPIGQLSHKIGVTEVKALDSPIIVNMLVNHER